MPAKVSKEEEIKKFWSRISITGNDDCWLWTAGKISTGYGSAWYCGKHWLAHRLSYFLTNGGIADGKQVLHNCDTPPCCNPKHLYEGTDADNRRDCKMRGRNKWIKGEDSNLSKLTEKIVTEIKASNESGATLGRKYGVWRGTINAIRRGETWKHVT